MPIVRNPNSATALANRIDRQSESQIIETNTAVGALNVGAGLEMTVDEPAYNWTVSEVAMSFSNAVARDFAIVKLAGARIIQNLNDHFWIRHNTIGPVQRVIIAPGLYASSAAFVTAIRTALNAQTAFNAAGITFTVVHADATTGLLTITPSSGQIAFIYDTGTTAPVSNAVRNVSLAGRAMGFNADTALAATATGDTGIDVGTVYVYLLELANTATSYVFTDPITMDMDSILGVAGESAGAVTMTVRTSHEVTRSIR